MDNKVSDPTPTRFHISALNLLVLYMNVYVAAKELGYADVDVTLKQTTERLNNILLPIKKEELEAALWACQQLSEAKERGEGSGFWHPQRSP